jgi:hypothetical protein
MLKEIDEPTRPNVSVYDLQPESVQTVARPTVRVGRDFRNLSIYSGEDERFAFVRRTFSLCTGSGSRRAEDPALSLAETGALATARTDQPGARACRARTVACGNADVGVAVGSASWPGRGASRSAGGRPGVRRRLCLGGLVRHADDSGRRATGARDADQERGALLGLDRAQAQAGSLSILA